MIEPTEIDLGPMTLVGLAAQTTQADLNATSARLWQLSGELELDKRIRNAKEPAVTLECQFNWHPTATWTFMLAMEVTQAEDVPVEATVRTIPAAKWLVFDLPGTIPNVDIVAGWNDIIEWLRVNDRSVPNRAYVQRYDETTGKAQNLIQLSDGPP